MVKALLDFCIFQRWAIHCRIIFGMVYMSTIIIWIKNISTMLPAQTMMQVLYLRTKMICLTRAHTSLIQLVPSIFLPGCFCAWFCNTFLPWTAILNIHDGSTMICTGEATIRSPATLPHRPGHDHWGRQQAHQFDYDGHRYLIEETTQTESISKRPCSGIKELGDKISVFITTFLKDATTGRAPIKIQIH